MQPQQSVNGSDASRVPDGEAPSPASTLQSDLREFVHAFVRGREFRLNVGGEMTQETMDRIIALLKLLKEDLPQESPPSESQHEQSSERLTARASVPE